MSMTRIIRDENERYRSISNGVQRIQPLHCWDSAWQGCALLVLEGTRAKAAIPT